MRYLHLLEETLQYCHLVTVNERLARFLWQAYFKNGKSVSGTVHIQSYSAWMHALWQRVEWGIEVVPSLMTEAQSLLLWQDIIEGHQDSPLLFVSDIASRAREAWLYIKKWQVPVKTFSFYLEHPAFLTWCKVFEERSQILGLHDEGDLLSLLLVHFSKVRACLFKPIQWVGFNDIPPALQALTEQLNVSGLSAQFFREMTKTPEFKVLSALNREEEWYHACQIASFFLKEHPQSTMAIVVPDLEISRMQILRVAQAVFLGSDSSRHTLAHEWPFTISGGIPLAHVPIIAHALLSLKLPITGDFFDWSTWIRSPFITGALEEKADRITLDLMLRSDVNKQVVFDHLMTQIAEQEGCPILQHNLAQIRAIPLESRQTFQAWYKMTILYLEAIGWPGPLALSSDQYQAVQHFDLLLEKLIQLDGIRSSVSYREYFGFLVQEAMNLSFAPESSPHARCHILGMLEASCLEFDRIWVCGLSDSVWPRDPSPNPFIPFVLARQYDLPRSSHARELRFAEEMMKALQKACSTLYISYPRIEEGVMVEKSPLIPQDQEVIILDPFENEALRHFRTRPLLEKRIEEKAPAIPEEERIKVKGGAGILQSQAVCPFQAFARYRLQASALPEPRTFLDFKARGLIVHEILEGIWRSLESRENLQKLSLLDRAKLIDRTITRIFDRLKINDPIMFSEAWLNLERERLWKLIHEWLNIEEQREDFKILELEKTFFLQLCGLSIKVRLDRIDQIKTGERLVMDYKTGKVSTKEWFGARPIAPQLPLYATVASADGIAFAEVRTSSCRLVGLAKNHALAPCQMIAEVLDADSDNWEDQKKIWRQTLENLAREFVEGDARVLPQSYEKGCRLCDLQHLCRIHDTPSDQGEEAIDS